MKSYRSAPSVFLLVGLIFSLVGIVFLPVGISLGPTDRLFYYVFGGVGAILLGVGLALIIIWHRRRQTAKKVVAAGRYVMARIRSISRNDSVTINGVHPYIVECDFTDPDNGIIHTFRSEDLMEDPSPYLNGSEVRVYIDPDSLDEYWVDLESVMNRRVIH